MNIFSVKKVKIRKNQQCWGCAAIFPPRTELERQVSADGGRIMSTYWCDTCLKFMGAYNQWDSQDEFDIGGLKEYPGYDEFVKSLVVSSSQPSGE